MTRTVKHTFDTVAEANAFVDGVEWVNDDAIECVDIEVGTLDNRPAATVICIDEEGDIDTDIDHREDPS